MLMSESLEIQEMLRRAMLDRYGESEAPRRFRAMDTICSATQDRQDAVLRMLDDGGLDLMVVIGGYNSSNTQALARICAGPPAHVPHRRRGLRCGRPAAPAGRRTRRDDDGGLAARRPVRNRPHRGRVHTQQRGRGSRAAALGAEGQDGRGAGGVVGDEQQQQQTENRGLPRGRLVIRVGLWSGAFTAAPSLR
jgi:hypothetical protein